MKIIKKFSSVIAAVFLGVLCLLQPAALPVSADSKAAYTDVLTDLKKDPTFDESKYPDDEGDYSLKVIQIAESTDGELFVYVYQPSDKTINLTATEIRMSTPEVGVEATYADYGLTLISENGVFDKYVVEDFKVKTDSVRYYNIIQIVRPYDKDLDKEIDYDNTARTTPFEVSQRWCAVTVSDDNIIYTMEALEVIEITDKCVGFFRYYEGFQWYEGDADYCDSHFVAFSTDRKIENLMEAELTYVSQVCVEEYNTKSELLSSELLGEAETIPIKLTDIEEGSNSGDGWFGKKYTWKRIESISDFLEEAKTQELALTKEGKTAIEKQDWILRFAETGYYVSDLENIFTLPSGEINVVKTGEEIKKTCVSDVTILRLKFKTDGKVYNLGVVDNKQTGSGKPSGTGGNNGCEDWKQWLGIILVVILFAVLAPILSPIISLLVHIVVWVIAAPFKLIGMLFKRRRK